jgi:hypothetical protein
MLSRVGVIQTCDVWTPLETVQGCTHSFERSKCQGRIGYLPSLPSGSHVAVRCCSCSISEVIRDQEWSFDPHPSTFQIVRQPTMSDESDGVLWENDFTELSPIPTVSSLDLWSWYAPWTCVLSRFEHSRYTTYPTGFAVVMSLLRLYWPSNHIRSQIPSDWKFLGNCRFNC